MIATIIKFADSIAGKTPMLEIEVKKADGETKTYKVPKFKKDVCKQLQGFNPGDSVNLIFREENGYMNIVGAEKSSGGGGAPAGGGGGRRGGWVPDPNKDRGVALRYAIDVMPMIHTEAQLKKMKIEDFVGVTSLIADGFVEYITGKSGETEPEQEQIPDPE